MVILKVVVANGHNELNSGEGGSPWPRSSDPGVVRSGVPATSGLIADPVGLSVPARVVEGGHRPRKDKPFLFEGEAAMSAKLESIKISLHTHAVARKTSAGLTMLFDRAKGVMYELNESASAVVGLLAEGPQGFGEIVEALTLEFDAAPEEIAADVTAFIDDFTDAGLLKRGDDAA
ncbi:PqqD family protein [Nocardia gipuzkoensis]